MCSLSYRFGPNLSQVDTHLAPISDLSEDKLNSGLQKIMVLGIATYNDGFPNTPNQSWPFCETTVYQTTVKQYFLEPCDPSVELPKVESGDWDVHNPQ